MKRRWALAVGGLGVAIGLGVALLGPGGTLSPDTVTASVAAEPAATGSVLTKAKLESPDAYRAARDSGARIASTPDGRSFYVQSAGAARGGKTIVTFHGYLSTAFDIFRAWTPEAQKRGLRVIAIQWRLGKTKNDSYSPAAMYAQARALLRRAGVPAGDALLHGYSSAASRMYGVAALDRRAHVFSLDVADAGGALKGFPRYREVFGAPSGRKTLAGTRWILFCGGRDPDPELTGCPVMRSTRAKIAARGGKIVRFIVDPRASHDGFLDNPKNTAVALEEFAGG